MIRHQLNTCTNLGGRSCIHSYWPTHVALYSIPAKKETQVNWTSKNEYRMLLQ